MKLKFGCIFLVLTICFSSVFAFAKDEIIYSEKELKAAITYLKEHRDELNITGYSIDENRNGLEVMAEKWTAEKQEQLKQLLGIENIDFVTDYGSVNENDGIVVRLMMKTADNAVYFRHSPERNSRVLVPVRGILEPLGYHVVWDNEEKKVTAISDSNKIILTIDEDKALFQSLTDETSIVNIDAPPVIINHSVYIPVRFISQISDYSVSWHENARMVIVE